MLSTTPAVLNGEKLVETLELSSELKRALSDDADDRRTVVLFGKRQCGACRALLPRVKHVALKQKATTRYLHIDLTPSTKDAFDEHDISIVPTLATFDSSGKLVEALCPAGFSVAALRKALDGHSWGV